MSPANKEQLSVRSKGAKPAQEAQKANARKPNTEKIAAPAGVASHSPSGKVARGKARNVGFAFHEPTSIKSKSRSRLVGFGEKQ
jgi:hypothetical protein